MRARIPSNLAGASLLGVHNWIKSQVALSNPGASPDYKLSDMSGNRMTLSDVAKNPGKDVMIEVATIEGVRSNPASAITAIPGLEMEYPMVPRYGNNLTEILPDEIDAPMAERVVAELGLRAGLHTLNRMTIQEHDPRITEPTSAALMQMGEIIRSNPSDRTPFTQRTPLIYGPERALAHWLAENSGEDVGPEDVKAETVTQVVNASIASKYGLTTKDIQKFAQDVLTDFMLAASANRALVRMLISKNPDNLKGDRETIHKLLAMFPQQPHQFYNGSQRVFVAHPAFIYPAYSSAILKNSQIKDIVKLAKNYPQSVRQDKLPSSITNMLSKQGYAGGNNIVTQTLSAGFQFYVGTPYRAFRDFLRGERSIPYDSAPVLDKSLERQPNIDVIAKRLMEDPSARVRNKRFKPLSYFTDLGGFYPTPPPKWPKEIMYAIMDTFLENLPHFLDVTDPSKSQLTPVRMAYLSEPTGVLDLTHGGGTEKYQVKDLQKIVKDVENRLKNSPAMGNLDFYKNLPLKKKQSPTDDAAAATTLADLVNDINQAFNRASELRTERELTFDPSGPKSILEMTYDVAETAQEKYGYNMRGDDFKFAMAVIHYSVETLTSLLPSESFSFSMKDFERARDKLLGGTAAKEFNRLLKKAENSRLDDDIKVQIYQQAILADLFLFYAEVVDDLSQPMTSEQRSATKARLQQDFDDIVSLIRSNDPGPTFDIASRDILNNIRSVLNDA